VAFVPPVQLATKEEGVILLMVTTAATGGGMRVVRLTEVESAVLASFTAVTTKLYIVDGESPVKVAVLLATPLSVEGVRATVFSVYV
jgi:hypothetical protein